MTHRLASSLLALGTVVALGSTLGAFGDSGHRIVGRVAELHLQGSRALTEVRRILRPQEALADATVWADTIKDPLYEDGDTPLFRLAHPAQDTYHYTNVAFQAQKYAPRSPARDRQTSCRRHASACACCAEPRGRSRRAKRSACSPTWLATCISRCTTATASSLPPARFVS